jgi:hypothetical protein
MCWGFSHGTTKKGIVLIAVFLFLFPAFAHAFCFEEAGTMYGISPQILWSIAKIESE